jgi:uncharacterized membrane protein
MTEKQLRFARVIVAAILAVVVSQALIWNNFILGATSVIIASLILFVLRKRVKEIVVDERDYKIAGDTARWTLSIFAIGGWLFSFALITMREVKPAYEIAGFTLSYAICALLFINIIVGLFFRRMDDTFPRRKRIAYFIFAFLLALIIVVAGTRLLSGEDDWICKDGGWIKHGNPSSAMPTGPCP